MHNKYTLLVLHILFKNLNPLSCLDCGTYPQDVVLKLRQLRTGSKGSFFSLSSIVIELGARWEDRLILIEEKTMEEDRYHEWKTHPRSRLRTNGLDDDSKDFRRIGWYGTVGIEF